MRVLTLIATTLAVAFVLGVTTSCTRNVPAAKACAPEAIRQAGFEIVGYEGYQVSIFYGGFSWYTIRRVPDNGIIYEVAVSPWNGECHLYNFKAIDAIKPS